MELTSYNSYTITPGRWNPYNSDDLRAMKIADAKIEADFSREMGKEMRSVNAEVPKRKRHDKPLTPEQRAKKNARDRAYHAAHRYERNERSRQYAVDHREEMSAQHQRWYDEHRDELLAKRRAQRAEKNK